MKVNVQQINGNWDCGYSLDKHMLSSKFLGNDEWGNPRFENTRTEIGESIYQLKYQNDFTQCNPIAQSIADNIIPNLPPISFIIAMPPSKARARQPVPEIAYELGQITGLPFISDFLVKTQATLQMKDIVSRDDKIKALQQSIKINEAVMNETLPLTSYNVLIVDDLYDSGTSLEVATDILSKCDKIAKIFVATATRKR
ncbi:ComF family protein [Vibrio parahaemolyticus]|uniref:ComF family protein n=1 Tax=Vibrio diabolicus TaxID=50719 RepID=UPI00215FCC55|nr:ComF family protein [Vibrio diabolicus]MCS0403599.1 ComF family protein [Vibrio diabolicus]HCG9119027.1 ComF family protein [Vibrio parahaemolyticus]